jgi:hypothetical protein
MPTRWTSCPARLCAAAPGHRPCFGAAHHCLPMLSAPGVVPAHRLARRAARYRCPRGPARFRFVISAHFPNDVLVFPLYRLWPCMHAAITHVIMVSAARRPIKHLHLCSINATRSTSRDSRHTLRSSRPHLLPHLISPTPTTPNASIHLFYPVKSHSTHRRLPRPKHDPPARVVWRANRVCSCYDRSALSLDENGTKTPSPFLVRALHI